MPCRGDRAQPREWTRPATQGGWTPGWRTQGRTDPGPLVCGGVERAGLRPSRNPARSGAGVRYRTVIVPDATEVFPESSVAATR
jgi:hypothetical protein